MPSATISSALSEVVMRLSSTASASGWLNSAGRLPRPDSARSTSAATGTTSSASITAASTPIVSRVARFATCPRRNRSAASGGLEAPLGEDGLALLAENELDEGRSQVAIRSVGNESNRVRRNDIVLFRYLYLVDSIGRAGCHVRDVHNGCICLAKLDLGDNLPHRAFLGRKIAVHRVHKHRAEGRVGGHLFEHLVCVIADRHAGHRRHEPHALLRQRRDRG